VAYEMIPHPATADPAPAEEPLPLTQVDIMSDQMTQNLLRTWASVNQASAGACTPQ
jgi:hypothetical protein